MMPTLPTLHMLAPFHTVVSLKASHCAFTGKVLRFAKMMKGFFPQYIEYANEGSESEAPEKVVMLRRKEMERLYPRKKGEFWGQHAKKDTEGWSTFNDRLHVALAGRIRPGDFVAHPFGQCHVDVVRRYPGAIHVETGIGYPDGPFGAYRVYESWAWAHSHWGRWGQAGLQPVPGENYYEDPGCNRTYSWVIPNYFDLEEWPIGGGAKTATPYVLFMGRIDASKGIAQLVTIIRAWCDRHGTDKLHFVIAGQGDWTPFGMILRKQAKAVQYLGEVHGLKRGPLIGGAVASLMPTQFIEPFGGSGVEGLLCGTPLLANAWGAFTETVTPGTNGYLCRTLGDWLLALENALAGKLSHRRHIAESARSRYSLEACREKYIKVFSALLELQHGKGAMSTDAHLWERP
jgi:glycosyltransferase involved in cell wall biosynthesis